MAGASIHVISVAQSGDSFVQVEFFVSTPDGVLTGSSLQSATEDASTQIQSKFGVTLHSISAAPSEESETNTGAIVGGVVGGMVLLFLVLIIAAVIITYYVGWVQCCEPVLYKL